MCHDLGGAATTTVSDDRISHMVGDGARRRDAKTMQATTAEATELAQSRPEMPTTNPQKLPSLQIPMWNGKRAPPRPCRSYGLFNIRSGECSPATRLNTSVVSDDPFGDCVVGRFRHRINKPTNITPSVYILTIEERAMTQALKLKPCHYSGRLIAYCIAREKEASQSRTYSLSDTLPWWRSVARDPNLRYNYTALDKTVCTYGICAEVEMKRVSVTVRTRTKHKA